MANLKDWIESLPNRTYVFADNAYIFSEHLLTPFYGTEQTDSVHNDTFHCFLSQLCICVEMSFGLLVTK
jgi:hypothetical protein